MSGLVQSVLQAFFGDRFCEHRLHAQVVLAFTS